MVFGDVGVPERGVGRSVTDYVTVFIRYESCYGGFKVFGAARSGSEIEKCDRKIVVAVLFCMHCAFKIASSTF